MPVSSDFFGPCNKYWQLREYHNCRIQFMKEWLDECKYYTGSKSKKEDIRYHLKRCDRGLMSYLGMNNDELRQLIRGRRLSADFGPGNKGTRAELISRLEEADKALTFNRFTSLPPELRNLVYGYYFADFENRPLHAPIQPPLTRVSRLLRKESLPLFYSSCIFEFNMVRMKAAPSKLQIALETSMWITNTRPENIASIQYLVIRVNKEVEVPGRRPLRAINVVLWFSPSDTALGYEIDYVDPYSREEWEAEEEEDEVRSVIQKGLRRLSDAPDEGRRLKSEDLFNLRRDLEAITPWLSD